MNTPDENHLLYPNTIRHLTIQEDAGGDAKGDPMHNQLTRMAKRYYTTQLDHGEPSAATLERKQAQALTANTATPAAPNTPPGRRRNCARWHGHVGRGAIRTLPRHCLDPCDADHAHGCC